MPELYVSWESHNDATPEFELTLQRQETEEMRHEVERLRKRVKETRTRPIRRYAGWG